MFSRVKRFKKLAVAMVGFGAILLQGCAVGPDYVRPEVKLPSQWQERAEVLKEEEFKNLQNWWVNFNDPMLENLIEKAGQNNPDIKAAIWRIEESRLLRNVAAGENLPDINASGFYSRDRASENGIAARTMGQKVDQTNIHNAGFDATWEIDIFGRIKRTVESSQANYEATIEDYRDVLVTLYAEIARNYIDLRSSQARIKYALANIKTQSETLKLTEDRFKAGIAPELDVTQAELNLANTESEIPNLRIQETLAINRIAILIGEYPGSLKKELNEFGGFPSTPEKVFAVMPAELLRNRPDIRRAERQLASEVARIGVSQAELYPVLSLSGTFALESTKLNDLGNIHSRTYGFGPGFRWNLFDGERLRNLVKVQKARTEQSILNYESSILAAVEDVENSLVSYAQENRRNEALSRSASASEKSVELVGTLYKNGLTDFQNVLDMQRTLVVQQDSLAVSEGNILQNIVRIYKSFGGGWNNAVPCLESKLECVSNDKTETMKN